MPLLNVLPAFSSFISQQMPMRSVSKVQQGAQQATRSTTQPVVPRVETKSSLTTLSPSTSPEIERHIKDIAPSMLSPAQKASTLMAEAIKRKWNVDVDPDNTRIVTFNYNLDHSRPANGKLLNSLTLTEAALKNVRSMNTEDERSPKHPVRDMAINITKMFIPMADAVEKLANPNDPHEYVFKSTGPETDHTYQAADKLPFTPQAYRDLVWQTELAAPYKSYLDKFWPNHEKNYTELSKLSFASAAQMQHKEGTLSNYETTLVMRAAGFGNDKRLEDITVPLLQAPYSGDPNVESGLLSINGSPSTDLMYVTDKQSRLNLKGQRVNHTLLYIPGNSSPIHRFDSVSQMKAWIADQASDPIKRQALCTHFKKNDQDDKFFSDGVNQALTGMGGWTAAQKPNSLGFTGISGWNPETYITTTPIQGDPFAEMTARQKARSYADANHDITTDRDIVKDRIVSVAEAAGAAALMLTPLAIVMPEVAVAMEATYLAAGIAEIGVGVDDAVHGKPKATDRIVFGALNAVPTLVHGAGRLPGLMAGAEGEAALASVPAKVQPPIEFHEVPLPGEDVPEYQVVELAGEDSATGGVKRTRTDDLGGEPPESIKRGKPDEAITVGTPLTGKKIMDLEKIDNMAFTFVDMNRGEERLNIVVHGVLGEDGTAKALVDGKLLTADEFTEILWDHNVPTDKYPRIRLMMCNSGTGGEASFAAQFQMNVGVPVKAYASKTVAEFNLDELAKLFKLAQAKTPIAQFDNVLSRNVSHRVVKVKPKPSVAVDGSTQDKFPTFSYKPVRYDGGVEVPKEPPAQLPSMPVL